MIPVYNKILDLSLHYGENLPWFQLNWEDFPNLEILRQKMGEIWGHPHLLVPLGAIVAILGQCLRLGFPGTLRIQVQPIGSLRLPVPVPADSGA
jgi:hypothetical protein